MNYLVYIYYPLLVILLLKGATVYKKNEWNDDFLSQKQTKAVQGFLAICVMFHHMAQKTCAPWLEPEYIVHGLDFFVPIGYLLVAYFFFCSGYGLYKSKKEKENYFIGFLWRRILPIVIASFVTSAIYLFVRIKMNEEHVLGVGKGSAFQFGGPQLLNQYGWYIYAILIVYFGFWLGFRWFKKESVSISIFSLVLVGYVFFCDWWLYGGWWYNTILVALLGTLFAKYEEKLVGFAKRKYDWFVSLLAIVTLVIFGFAEMNQESLYTPWVRMVVAITFAVVLILLGMKIKIGNKVLTFLGGYTLELYLIHGIFVQLFGYCFYYDEVKPLVYIRNTALYVLVVLILSIPTAFGLKHLDRLILKGMNLRKKELIDMAKWGKNALLILLGIFLAIEIYLGFDSRNQAKEHAQTVETYRKENITYAMVDGKKMSAYVVGEGEHTIVMFGGLEDATPAVSLRPIADALADNSKVIILEQFGRGFSDDTEQIRDAEHITEELHEALKALEVKEPYILMPHYNAGIYAQYYIRRYGNEVEGLIGLDSWIPDQLQETLLLNNQTEEAYNLYQKRYGEVLHNVVQVGEPLCGLARNIWHSGEEMYVFSDETELVVMEEVATKKYANKNAMEELQYHYEDAKPLFGQKFENDFPVLFLLGYQSERYTYRDLEWEKMHNDMFTNPEIQKSVVLKGSPSLVYYMCPEIEKRVKSFLGESL